MFYTPSSLILSDDDPVRKYFKTDIREREKKDYDYKTIFFDAVCIGNSNRIRVFAPPMLNLLSRLGAPIFYDGSDRCKYKRRVGSLGRFEEWTVWNPFAINQIKDLTVVFPKGKTYKIRVNRFLNSNRNKKILTAIQKNNKVQWIQDWYGYYKKHFGIDQLVLYDNGSENYDDLASRLPENAILVKWNFPYGPSISHGNKFTQIGALNHCRLVFGKNSTIFSFDIDEILVDPSDLIKHNLDHFNVHYFASYFVPYTDGLPDNYSFNSFLKRYRKPNLTGKKYIYRSNKSTGVLPHYVHSYKIRLLDDLTIILKKGINSIQWTNNQRHDWRTRILGLILDALTLGIKQKNYLPHEAYFLHFRGITTNWKERGNRLDPHDNQDLIDDSLLKSWNHDQQLYKEIGDLDWN